MNIYQPTADFITYLSHVVFFAAAADQSSLKENMSEHFIADLSMDRIKQDANEAVSRANIITELPPELVYIIFSKLEPLDIYHCTQVSREWKILLTTNAELKKILLISRLFLSIEKLEEKKALVTREEKYLQHLHEQQEVESFFIFEDSLVLTMYNNRIQEIEKQISRINRHKQSMQKQKILFQRIFTECGEAMASQTNLSGRFACLFQIYKSYLKSIKDLYSNIKIEK